MEKERNDEFDAKIVDLYNELLEQNKENSEENNISQISYNPNMTIVPATGKYIGLEDTIFVVEKKTKGKDGKEIITHELYNEEKQKIGETNEKGVITFQESYIEMLKNRFKNMYREIGIGQRTITMEQLREQNKELEEVALSKEEIEEINKERVEEGKDETEPEEPEEEQEEKIDSKKLQQAKENGSSGIITSCAEIDVHSRITDHEYFKDIVPGGEKYEKVYVIASNDPKQTHNKFQIVGVTRDGEVEPIQGLEETEGVNAGQQVANINRDGSRVEKEQVSAMFKVGNSNKGFAVHIGQHGRIEAQYYRRTNNDEYVSVDINAITQRPVTKEVKEYMDSSRNPDWTMRDSVDRANEQLEKSGESIQVEDIDNNPYNDKIDDQMDEPVEIKGEGITTRREEAQRMGMTQEEYISMYQETNSLNPDEKIKQVREMHKEQMAREEQEKEEDEGKALWDGHDFSEGRVRF